MLRHGKLSNRKQALFDRCVQYFCVNIDGIKMTSMPSSSITWNFVGIDDGNIVYSVPHCAHFKILKNGIILKIPPLTSVEDARRSSKMNCVPSEFDCTIPV